MNEENLFSKYLRSITLALCLVFAGGGMLVGCDQGPAEETGEEIDDAADDAGDAIDDATD